MADKARAISYVDRAPWGTRVTFQGPKRTLDQNSKLWACLTDVATQLKWHGQTLSPEDWKVLFLAALNTEMRIVPNLDNTGFVPLGRSSSNLSVAEMVELIELILAFGAQHGVVFHDGETPFSSAATDGERANNPSPVVA
jgi:hypothetical protein